MVHGVLNIHGVFINVLLENGGLPFIFPFKVHLDFGIHCVLPCAVPDLGHPPDTQEYLGLLSEPFNTTLDLLKVSLIMFYLNMMDYLMSSLLLST